MEFQKLWRSHRRAFSWFCCISVAIIILVILVFIFVLINKPHELKIVISEASISQFTLSKTNNTLSYSLALTVALRNPNRKGRALFDRVQVSTIYHGKMFSAVNLTSVTPFYLGHKNTTLLRSVHRGVISRSPNDSETEEYGLETSGGVYTMDVKLDVRVRAKYSGVETRYFDPPQIICENLKVPTNSSATDISKKVEFRTTKCRNIFIFKTHDVKNHGPSSLADLD